MDNPDTRVGWPDAKPAVDPYNYGWFWPANQIVLKSVLSASTKIVVELGSFLGKSTRFILDHAPNAKVYAIDLWANEFILNEHGDHYAKSELNRQVLERVPLYETFLVNFWDVKDRLVPLRMTTLEGLDYLKEVLLISDPDVIYVDADHHYEGAKKDIEKSLKLFPSSLISGDDFDYAGVRQAVEEVSKAHEKPLHVEDNKCWIFKLLNNPAPKKHSANLLPKKLFSVYDSISAQFGTGSDPTEYMLQHLKANFDLLNCCNSKRKCKTLLMEAAEKGDSEAVKMLLAQGASPNVQSPRSYQCALTLAAFYGKVDVLKILLEKGADPELRNNYGESARDAAATRFQTECLSILDEFINHNSGHEVAVSKRCPDENGEEFTSKKQKQ